MGKPENSAQDTRVQKILTKRSGSIYRHMRERAQGMMYPMPFTLEEFRIWLSPKFGLNGTRLCDYSGEMILVENFSIDHRLPISRGGGFGFDNLALCSEKQNLRKGNMTALEYQAFAEYVEKLPTEVKDSIWKRMEIGDVQRFSHFRRVSNSRKARSK